MKRLKKWWKIFKKELLMSFYTSYFYKKTVNKQWILIDSKNGKDLGSNMLRIAEELVHNPDYRAYKVFVSCNKEKRKEIKKMLATYNMNRVKLIDENSFKYAKVIALARFLFTDTSFPLWFVKKEGQIITNSWHGTPLKKMGKDVPDRSFDMGNVQKSFLVSDYLLYPSDYMKDIMVKGYFLDNIYKGKILCSGYPRNSVFFNAEKGNKIRKELGLENKKLYGYMPTWRGNLKNRINSKIINQLEYYFVYLDERLEDDEIFFVRLHPFVANSIDYSLYKHIKPFPEGYEPYDILNACDCMVTDYSSVFFDFANSRKKIVLFVYDKEFYMDERGAYVSLDSFPFPQVRRAKDLLAEIRAPKNYDDTEFIEKYCQYDSENVAQKVCAHIVKGTDVYEEQSVSNNGRENVIIYSGSMGKNGLTTAMLNLLANVDREKRNYIVTFRSASLKKEPLRVTRIPNDVAFVPIAHMGGMSWGERRATERYFEKNITDSRTMKKVDRFYARLFKCVYGHFDVSCAIHYAGYEKEIINLYLQAPCKRVIFSHNDMVEEIRTKGNQHEPSLKRAYNEYDKVAPVSKDIYGATLQLGRNENNIQIVSNCHDYLSIREKAKQELTFDLETVCNVSKAELNDVLNSNSRKIINIGRFSHEKGHDMLLAAFDKYHKENPDSYLIIIGGYGPLYSETLALASSLKSYSHIIIVKSILNPMPILGKCDLFVLSSRYEGLGLVLLEADTLGVPAFSTDIQGPSGLMKKYGGHLVSADVDGIYSGFKDFDEGKIKAIGVDYEEYNKEAVAQFEQLFEGEIAE